MSDRQLKILFGILVLLVAAWVAARLVTGGGESDSEPFDLAQLGEAKLDSVVITGTERTIRLRSGDGWTVNGYRAMSDAGESLKRAFEAAQVGQLVSRNAENHERLGVSEEKGTRFTAYVTDGTTLELIVGGRGGAFDQAYVRRAGDDQVYLLQGNLVNLARRGVEDWREREILRANREDIQRIEYEYGETGYALVRDSAAWRIDPRGASARSEVVSGILNQLSGLRAIGFAADTVADTLSWEPASGRVRVFGLGESELGTVVFLKRQDVGYYVRREGSPVVYTVSAYTGDQILKREEDLIPPPAEGGETPG